MKKNVIHKIKNLKLVIYIIALNDEITVC